MRTVRVPRVRCLIVTNSPPTIENDSTAVHGIRCTSNGFRTTNTSGRDSKRGSFDSDGDTEKRAETGGAKGVDETAECEYSRHPDNEQRECTNGDACLNCTSAAERGG
jgi:hypothetical protein